MDTKIPNNVLCLAIVGFFMNFGATIVHGTGNTIATDIISPMGLLLLKGLTESIPHFVKVFSGYLSDLVGKRKVFLLIGYGSMIIFKIFFTITTLDWLFPIDFLCNLFVVTQICDRIMNAMRDAPRDALILDSTDKKDLNRAFSIRKGVTSLGSIVGAFVAFILWKILKVSKTWLYFFSITPTFMANVILVWLVKDIKIQSEDNKKEKSHLLSQRTFLWIITCIVWSIFILKTLINSLGDFGILVISLPFYASLEVIIFKREVFESILFSTISLIFSRFFHFLCGGLPFYVDFFLFCTFTRFLLEVKKRNIFQLFLEHKEASKKFLGVLAISCLVIFGKMNDTAILFNAEKKGIHKDYAVLLFGAMYVFITIFSYISGKIMKKIGRKNTMLMAISLLLAGNFFISYGRCYYSAILSIFFIGSYAGLMDVLSSNMIAESVFSKNIRGTFFGSFFFISGLSSVISSLICKKLIVWSGGYSVAGIFCLINNVFAIIAVILFF